jgi:endonuclease/exonuclease/phosphatase family metal-dependent hydrolase
VAAQGGVSLTAAGLWIALGTLAGVWAVLAPRPRRLPPLPDWLAPAPPVLLAVAVFTLLLAPGLAPLTALATVAGLATLPAVLRAALGGHAATGRGALADLAVAGAGCGLGYLVLVLPGQLRAAPDWWPVLGALVLGVAAGLATGTGATSPSMSKAAPGPLPSPFLPVLLATGLLAFPPLAAATHAAPDPLPTDTAGGTYRLLSWNVHHAVDGDGELVPDDVLDVIRRSSAHVVVLQEVPRGWPAAGGLDLAAWLERRLDAEAVWSPAADRQFGNLILTSLPVLDSETESLPQAGGGMDRSYASVTVRLTDGESASVTTTHLEGDADASETRMRQLREVMAAVGEVPDPDHAVLAGDFNAEPDSAEIDTVLESGFSSAQDEAGDPGRLTHLDPRRRVDWIFGAGAVAFEDFEILDTADIPAADASDHLPLTTTIWLD